MFTENLSSYKQNLLNPGSSANFKQNKQKGNHSQTHYCQTVENQRERKKS